ncbi:MAG: hypothetical protein RLY20_1091 [Verrucomicrobiota bacterium]|jgi:hypothetical protein
MGFDVESIIGTNCLLNIQHNQVSDKTYANVVSIMPLVKGMPKMTAAEYVRKKDRQDTEPGHVSDEEIAAGQHHAPITDDDIPF